MKTFDINSHFIGNIILTNIFCSTFMDTCFALLYRNKLTILDPREYLCRIASRPGAHNLRCLFRVNFVPIDAYELLRKDSVAFEYLYVQCCNDVTQVIIFS